MMRHSHYATAPSPAADVGYGYVANRLATTASADGYGYADDRLATSAAAAAAAANGSPATRQILQRGSSFRYAHTYTINL